MDNGARFEFQFLYTRSMALECQRAANRALKYRMRIAQTVTASATAFCAVVMLTLEQWFYGAALVLLAGILVYQMCYRWRRIAERRYLRATRESGLARTFRFFDSHFETIEASGKETIEYNRLTSVIETEALYVLLEEKTARALYKKSVVEGNSEEFAEFLSQRAVIRVLPRFPLLPPVRASSDKRGGIA